jgi:hypothetical protein
MQYIHFKRISRNLRAGRIQHFCLFAVDFCETKRSIFVSFLPYRPTFIHTFDKISSCFFCLDTVVAESYLGSPNDTLNFARYEVILLFFWHSTPCIILQHWCFIKKKYEKFFPQGFEISYIYVILFSKCVYFSSSLQIERQETSHRRIVFRHKIIKRKKGN